VFCKDAKPESVVLTEGR